MKALKLADWLDRAAQPGCDKTLLEAAATLREQAMQLQRLQNRLFAVGAMRNAPCFCCGYNGPGYYDSKVHACAKKHHDAHPDEGKSPGTTG